MGNVARMAEARSLTNSAHCAQIILEAGLSGSSALGSEAVGWFALSIHQYKREKCQQMLVHLGYEHFSPCTTSVRAWSDRRKQILAPLFPGYIFCRFNPEKRLALLQIPGILGIVGSGKCFLEIAANEIEAIRIAVASRLPMEPLASLVPGQKVTVVDGPLRGVEGVLVRVQAQSRLLLSVSMLNRGVSVEVEAHHLAVQQ